LKLIAWSPDTKTKFGVGQGVGELGQENFEF